MNDEKTLFVEDLDPWDTKDEIMVHIFGLLTATLIILTILWSKFFVIPATVAGFLMGGLVGVKYIIDEKLGVVE